MTDSVRNHNDRIPKCAHPAGSCTVTFADLLGDANDVGVGSAEVDYYVQKGFVGAAVARMYYKYGVCSGVLICKPVNPDDANCLNSWRVSRLHCTGALSTKLYEPAADLVLRPMSLLNACFSSRAIAPVLIQAGCIRTGIPMTPNMAAKDGMLFSVDM